MDHPRPTSAPEAQGAFLELGRLDLAALPLGQVLRRVAELAQATVPGTDEASVTLFDGDAPRSASFTGDLAVHLDERQYSTGFGPCLDAAREGRVVAVPDMERDERYPDFAAVAVRAGVHSSLSVGTELSQRPRGGLNLYSRSVRAFDDPGVLDLARTFVDYAAVALANAALLDAHRTLSQQLERALASRAVIEQAKGILMARTGWTADEAFAELVRRSQHLNRKLRDLAAELVAGAATGSERR
jgi:GAF domain-containing protein